MIEKLPEYEYADYTDNQIKDKLNELIDVAADHVAILELILKALASYGLITKNQLVSIIELINPHDADVAK